MLAAIDRDDNTVRDYDLTRALRLVTLKLVGYTEVVHQLAGRMDADSSVVVSGRRSVCGSNCETTPTALPSNSVCCERSDC